MKALMLIALAAVIGCGHARAPRKDAAVTLTPIVATQPIAPTVK